MNNENTSRAEQYLQAIANSTGAEGLPEPQSRLEQIFLAVATGDASHCPEPQSRLEAAACACVGAIGGGEPDIAPLEITKNGTYTAEDVDGFSPVTVNVETEPDITPLEITENGTYTAKDVDGYSPVTVNVADKKVIVPLEVTENGTFAEEGVDGYYPVTVNVASSAGAQATEFLASTTGTNVFLDSFGAFCMIGVIDKATFDAWYANTEPVKVVYDGEEYTLTPQEVMGGKAVGNLTVFGGTGNGEEFAIVAIDEANGDGSIDYYFIIGSLVDTAPTDHTVRVYQEDLGDGKYLEAQHENVVLANATNIKPYAFYADTVVKSVEAPNVVSIGNYAFSSCSGLKSIEMPNVETIGDYAFGSCRALETLVLPNGLKSVGNRAFTFCGSLTTITFTSKPTLGDMTFYSATKLTAINVPWAEGEVSGAPWGAGTNTKINYNYTGE